MLDAFIARRGIDHEAATEAASLSDADLAGAWSTSTTRGTGSSGSSRGLTPARLARVVSSLDAVEMMFALKKLRARRAPANQAHVTNLKESPALLAADAAERRRAASPNWRRRLEYLATRRSTRSRCSSARRPAARA